MALHFDDLETRDPAEREDALFAALPGQIAHAKANAPYFGRLLAEVDPASVRDRGTLATLPVTRKADVPEIQAADPPFGGLCTVPPGGLARIFMSPGPIFEPEAHGRDPWRMARALYASGMRPGDLLHNTFAYHLTPAGSMFETAGHAVGCTVIPAGTGNTEQQVQMIARLRPRAYVGTPDFLKVLIDKADAAGIDASSIRIGHVTGGPFLPDARAFYQARDIAVFQSYGTADLGLIAYETPARDGLVVDEGVIVEIVRPGTGDPVPDGEVGEVVVTSFSATYPLVRFATGDLSAVLSGVSACGRTNVRLKGWMGRADQTTKIKGMFVHPHHVADVLKRHPEIARARLVVGRADASDTMTLVCESTSPGDALATAISETLTAATKLRGAVLFVPVGSLPNDGKVIEDGRG